MKPSTRKLHLAQICGARFAQVVRAGLLDPDKEEDRSLMQILAAVGLPTTATTGSIVDAIIEGYLEGDAFKLFFNKQYLSPQYRWEVRAFATDLAPFTIYPNVLWADVFCAKVVRDAIYVVRMQPLFLKHNQLLDAYAQHKDGAALRQQVIETFGVEGKYNTWNSVFLRQKKRARKFGCKV